MEERIDELEYDNGINQFILIRNNKMIGQVQIGQVQIGQAQIGQIQTVITECEIIAKRYYTRSTRKQEKKVISITSITIDDAYQNQGLGIKLLFHCLKTLIKRYPEIQYSVLDDCSNNSNKIKTNIYHKLGYYFTDHTSLQTKKTIHSLGPEKQLDLSKLRLKE
jgi:ribosomal protein S18 acetylase RimI-like enzyme